MDTDLRFPFVWFLSSIAARRRKRRNQDGLIIEFISNSGKTSAIVTPTLQPVPVMDHCDRHCLVTLVDNVLSMIQNPSLTSCETTQDRGE